MKTFLKKNWKKLLAVFVLLILIIIVVGKGKNNTDITTFVVEKGDVLDELVLSGEARPIEGAEMAFATSGMVSGVYKRPGDKVFSGEKIIELDNAALYADLSEARANLDLIKAENKITDAELDREVENAYNKLLSDDLIAYSENLSIENEAPEISGIYTGGIKGEYVIRIEPDVNPPFRSMKYSGLEKGTEEIVYYKAIPLGSKGLYIRFSEGEVDVSDKWTVEIPNVEGENYIENLNAYESALASRDAAAENNVSLEISEARIKQAEARVARIQAEINERTLRAPFSGIVSKVDIKKGEIASSGTIVTGVISDNVYEVEVEVPEVDIVNLAAGLSAQITLDPYTDVVFEGTLISIDLAETEVDGVSVYKAKVSFKEVDERIRSGMTAKVEILKGKAEDVLRVPERFIRSDKDGEFVLVLEDEIEEKTHIETGLRGFDGMVEIKNGLEEGETVVGHFEE